MLIRRRLFGFAVFGVATILVSGVSLATQPPRSSVSASPPIDVAHVPVGNPLPPNPTVDERLERVMESSIPGPERDRMMLVTRLAEIGPGGSRAEDATQRGAGVAGIAAGVDGIRVALTSEDSRVSTQEIVERELASILAVHPELSGFGTLTYEVMDLTTVATSTPGGWKALQPSTPSRYCSVNSTVYTTYMGITFWYWLTAGHCNVVTPAQSALDGPFNWASGSATGASDSGLWYLGTYPVAAASNLIADGWSAKPISTQSDRGNFDNLGDYVCATGATSGTGCGTLVWKWGTALSGIYYMRELDYTGTIGGDSGGPSFGRYPNGTVSLMGVVHGYLNVNMHALYSDLGLSLMDRGVTLYR